MMGIFSNTSGLFDADIDKVTPEEDKGSEDWGCILDICDKVGTSSTNAKDCLKAIIRRLNHPSPHVVLKAISLLDACVKNCSKKFLLEVASREFEVEYRKLLKKFQTTNQPRLADNFKHLLRKWAENEFKSDSELNFIPSLYSKLKSEGVDFPANLDSVPKSNQALPKDPDAVTSQQEVDDIAKAIELSLKESNLTSGQNSLYPSTNSMNSNTPNKSYNSQSQSSKPKQIVKALYDFLDVEDNELVFYAGELIEVLDDSDKNWWKGATRRGEGLFPANFVTADLSSDSNVDAEPRISEKEHSNKNNVRFNDNVGVRHTFNLKQEDIIIDEQKIDRLLHLLHEANPTDESADTEEMTNLEEEVNAMGPLIDAELEKVDRKHAQLTHLSSNLVDALNLYHSLMREQPFLGNTMMDPTYGPMSMPVHNLPHPQAMMYNTGLNAPYSMPPASMMSDQYVGNSLPGPMQQAGNVHDMSQPTSHHFVPIATVPVQSDGFHPAAVMTNSSNAPQSYNPSLDPNLGPIRYNMQPNPLIPPQQIPQNMYQPIQHQMPLQEVSSPGTTLPNNSSM